MEPILHFIIPVAILLLLKIDKKMVFLLSPLTVIYDADIVTQYHRALFHTVFFGIFLALLMFIVFRKKQAFFITLFFYAAHILMDFDKAGIGLLFPLTNNAYGFDISSFSFVINKVSDIQFQAMPVAQIIINSGLLAIVYAAFFFYSRKDL